MGNSSKKIKNKQVLICGLDSAGKTTLFKLLVYGFQKEKAENPYQELNKLNDEPTFGFNFEYAEKDQAQSIGFWDLGGKDSIRAIWPSFYKNIAIGGIIFVVDSNDSDDRINEARMELLKLLNEEELRSAVVYVVFNDVIKNTDNDEKESPILRDYKKQNLVLEERIGFNMIHPGIIKQSVFLNLLDIEAKIREAENLKEKNDAYEKIASIKNWLVKQMDGES